MRIFPRLAVLIPCAAGLVAQTGRDSYRQAFDAWQQAQTNLERNAGAGGQEPVSQADRAASAEALFGATRAAYLKSLREDAAKRRQLLQDPFTHLSPDLASPVVGAVASAELQTVTRTVSRFANDPDRGIQQLRQALERERVALTALNETIQARQKAMTATSSTAASLEQARTRTAEAFADEASQLSQTFDEVQKEGAAWTEYYASLSQAIQTANAPPPAPVAPVPPVVTRNEAVARIPLVRFVGAWDYPATNGIFHGPQPLAIELEIRETNGHADGSLTARFKPVPGSTGDSTIKFTFAGEFGATPTQRFRLMTSDGTPGIIELIPGPAFNLLEVNFQTDPQPNKIRLGNFILVKK